MEVQLQRRAWVGVHQGQVQSQISSRFLARELHIMIVPLFPLSFTSFVSSTYYPYTYKKIR